MAVSMRASGASGQNAVASTSASTTVTSGNDGQQQQPAGNEQQRQQPVDDPLFGPLEKASRVIDERLLRDDRWQGIGESLSAASSSDYILPPNPAWLPFYRTRSVHIPDRLFQDHTVGSSWAMGLFPEIERAWVTIDNKLFLWDWLDGSSISAFEELNDIIVGVGIVKPRQGVFVDSISHLLVLNTPSQVNLVGIGFPPPTQPGAKPELTFYLTDLSASTEGVSLTKVKGTSNGRIFLASSPEPLTPGGIGGDGCLYELVYQSAEGWFSKKCTLHNRTSGSLANSVIPSFLRALSAVPKADWIVDLQVDDERGLLYCLLRNGAIEMFSIAPPASGPSPSGQAPTRLAKTSDIQRQALVILPGNPMISASKFKIVALQVIPVREAGNGKIGLVAVSNTGVRLYFTHQRRGYSYYASSSHPLELCHVRPPPSPSTHHQQSAPQPQQQQQQQGPNYFASQQMVPASSQPQQQQTIPFNNVAFAVFSSGGLFVASNPLPDLDAEALLVASPDIAASARSIAENQANVQQRAFTEIAGTLEVPSETCAIAEVSKLSTVSGPTGLNELATQITQARREWVILTKTSANVIVRQRPIDTLKDIIEGLALNASSSGAHGDIGVFFESYGRDQACSMLLALAADNSRASLSKPSPNVNAFQGMRQTSVSLAEQAKSLFFEGGGRPISFDRGGFSGTASTSTSATGAGTSAADSKVIYSGRHEGLAFYFARLVRPIWKSKVTVIKAEPGNPNKQVAALGDTALTNVQRDLVALRNFVEQEYHIFTQLPEEVRATMNSSAYQAEQASLSALRKLLTQTVEAISFVLLLIDYRISDIVASCSPDDQKAIADLTYQTLITTKKGRDLARSLVSAVINQQIGRQLSVDAISDTLQQRCGSFCSADDVLLYKAIEATRRAKDTPASSERLESLRESLRLFTKASSHLSLERLKDICAEYNDLNYPLGIVDLCLVCAETWDAGKRGLSHWLDGCPPNDPRSSSYDLRKQCYELVFQGLEKTDVRLNEAAAPNGQASGSSTTHMSLEEADSIRMNAYNKALASQDELFHENLYDWFVRRGMTDQLLEIRTPYIERFLSRDTPSFEKTDLLWQYYVRTGAYAKAGEVLAALAETSLFPLSLYKRIEYLSLAVSNYKSAPAGSSAYLMQQANDAEEKLEVGQVQIEVFRAIEEMDLEAKQDWLARAEDHLYTISELYQQFVEPLNLQEIALLVFHVSDHRDTELVMSTWEEILARVQESVPQEARFNALRAKVVELSRRFCTSDVSFPLPQLVILLSTWTLENRSIAPASWLPLALNESGVPWEALFATYDDLTVSRVPPFHTPDSLAFLLRDASVIVESWLSHATVAFGRFPATEVDTAIGRYLLALDGIKGKAADGLHEDKGAIEARLKEAQRRVRRDY